MGGAKILIAEDGGIIAFDLKERLAKLGYSADLIVNNGNPVTEITSNTLPNIILMDVGPGNYSARLEIAQQVRFETDIPIIFLLAHEDEDINQRVSRIASSDYLIKPYEDGELYAKIELALSKSLLEQAFREKEEALRIERDQMQGIFDTAQVIFLIIDEKGIIQKVNKFGQMLLGYSQDGLLGKNWFDTCIPETNREEIRHNYQRMIFKDLDLIPTNDYDVVTRNNEILSISWSYSLLSSNDGRSISICASGENRTEQKQALNRLRYNAEHDPLTGLPNRMAFLERLEASITCSSREYNHRYAVFYLDLDSFKLINDSFGHRFGDRYLVATARRLESCLGPDDMIARLSGDEFYILVDHISSPVDTIQIAERIQKELNTPILLDGQSISTSCSIGIVICSRQNTFIDDIMQDADIAMYQAKARGKAGYSFFVPAMRTQPKARLKLENDLRLAVEQKDFSIVYQPILDLNNQRCSGVEALLRWNHPEPSKVSTAETVTILEETGLIIPLGEWVLQQVCLQLKTWQVKNEIKRDFSISVNVSVRQLTYPSFIDQVINAIKSAGVSPKNLVLELTESIFLIDTEMARIILLRLNDLGIRTHIDDFGTGYSSLKYLQSLPFEAIKIDQSFVLQLDSVKQQREIIHSIVGLATTVGANTIAEGVETFEQYQMVKAIGCTQAQGYFISRPLTADELSAWLRKKDMANLFKPIISPIKLPVRV